MTVSSFLRTFSLFLLAAAASFGEPVLNRPAFKEPLITGYIRGGHIRWNWIGDEHLNKTTDIIYMNASVAADGSLTGVSDFRATKFNGVTWQKAHAGREGVFAFKGPKAFMSIPGIVLPQDLKTFTFEASYAPQGAQNAELIRSGDFRIAWKGDTLSIQNGANTYQGSIPAVPAGQWVQLGCIVKEGIPSLFVNGKAVALLPGQSQPLTSIGNATLIGTGYTGMMDELRVWKEARPVGRLGRDISPTWADRLLYFHLPADTGRSMGEDKASWASQIAWIRSRLRNPADHMVRLGIAGGAWKDMLRDPKARQKFAGEIASIVNRYKLDGVDLDFEWIEGPYKGDAPARQWDNYADLAQRIRKAQPDMCFTISLHVVCYRMPKKGIDAVDYFTFQNYGPSSARYPFDDFTRSLAAFRKQGFPDSKIMLSVPFQGTGDAKADSVRLYSDIVAQHPNLPPTADTAEFTYPDGTKRKMTFNGPATIRKKCEYAKAQKLRGIMYWDMGGDVRTDARKGQTDYRHPKALLPVINEILKGRR
ncbi:hypothetical protein ICN84_05430 [Akkermansia glycaniphila]|uniref:glycosyl hydrolase family 18 protein n=1 Tax=Akkermansia glycaniphila TaxID=1679444 RepID=UPI001C00AAD8|nr:glycosyl hydrolase family 18 protein [Akkermansia glycaniphila]MBT9449515.1 hypothetical protein [Akkermansia glycaniphila]